MQQTNSLVWIWNKKPIPLEELDEKQLYSIKRSIENSENKVWFGNDSKEWIKHIDDTISYKHKVMVLIKKMRFNRAIKDADTILNGMMNCMNKTNQKLVN